MFRFRGVSLWRMRPRILSLGACHKRCSPVLEILLKRQWVYWSVLLFQPKYRLAHPEVCLLLLSKEIFFWIQVSKKCFILFCEQKHWYWLQLGGCALVGQLPYICIIGSQEQFVCFPTGVCVFNFIYNISCILKFYKQCFYAKLNNFQGDLTDVKMYYDKSDTDNFFSGMGMFWEVLHTLITHIRVSISQIFFVGSLS